VTLPIKLGFKRFLRINGGPYRRITTKRLFLLSMSTALFVTILHVSSREQ